VSAQPWNGKVSLSIRIPAELHDRLNAAARERVVSVNLLVNAAIVELLEDLVPVDELRRGPHRVEEVPDGE
jgi:predicted HicB family RNase H-like nuclease